MASKNPKGSQGTNPEMTAMAAAFARAGIHKTADISNVFGEAAEAARGLDQIAQQAESLDPETMRAMRKALEDRAKTDADVLGRLYQVRAEIERIPNWENSVFASKHEEAQKLINDIRNRNPYAAEMAVKRAQELRRERTEDRREAYRDEVKEMRSGTVSLHDACTGEGSVAVRVRFPERRDGQETGRTREGWVKLEVTPRGARICGATLSVQFLVKYGNDQKGQPKLVPLHPPTFQTSYGEPFFPNLIREALEALYRFEESVMNDRTLTTGTVSQLLAGEAVRVIVYNPSWREPRDWNKPRAVKIDIEGDGQGSVRVHRVETSFDWSDLTGKDFSLTSLDKRLANFLKFASNRADAHEASSSQVSEQPTDEES